MGNVIEVKEIEKRYKKQVLDGISFTADKGDIIGILGANGCGKTTLLSIMSGMKRADSGELLFDGKSAFKDRKLFKKYVGYVPQENPLIDELTTADNLKLWYSAKNYKLSVQDGIIQRLGLTDYLNKRVDKLSGGMKRRISIAIALAENAPVLIMDEPGAALDIYGKEEIRNYIKEYTANGGTVVMSTHDETEIKMCNTLYVMKNGILNRRR
jgi:ABC-2 type transport system ATP-binding protein